jgi:hypothetical protein
MANGETLVTAPDGSQTFVSADGGVTETTVNEDGSTVVDNSDGTRVQQSVSDEGMLTSTYASEAPEGTDAGDAGTADAAPVPQGVQQDPNTGQTTVVLSSGEAVGHSLGNDGVLTMQSTALVESAGGTDAVSDEGDGAEADGASAGGEIRLSVINPSVGEVITEGEVTLVESTFTDAGGIAMEIAQVGAESDAEPATVEISADGTQQAISSPTGGTAVATTSETGVVIAMDEDSMQESLDNLDPGDEQPMVATDGSSVVASTGADGETEFLDVDGLPATHEDGTEYTAEDMAAMVVAFDEE